MLAVTLFMVAKLREFNIPLLERWLIKFWYEHAKEHSLAIKINNALKILTRYIIT